MPKLLGNTDHRRVVWVTSQDDNRPIPQAASNSLATRVVNDVGGVCAEASRPQKQGRTARHLWLALYALSLGSVNGFDFEAW